MKAYYYYKRYENKPMVTHCFLIVYDTDGYATYARGTAVCSYNDIPCKQTGRAIALGRAVKAYKNMRDSISEFPCGSKSHPYLHRFYKGRYKPDFLKEIEKKILKKHMSLAQ